MTLRSSPNLSISMMALSNAPLESDNAWNYQRLCKSTEEGLFVNLVEQDNRADWLA